MENPAGPIHKTLRVTPAMAAGVTDQLWLIANMLRLIDVPQMISLLTSLAIMQRPTPALT
jgi:hypothetical protein